MRNILTWLFTCLTLSFCAQAQETQPLEGLSDEQDLIYVFDHASLVIAPGRVLNDASLVVRKDRIIAAGQNVARPKSAIVIDLKGKFIYPSFIEPLSSIGQPERKENARRNDKAETTARNTGYWNPAIHPETDAVKLFTTDAKRAEELRAAGFGFALSMSADGIVRGTGALVALGDDLPRKLILRDRAALGFSFDKGSSNVDYPSSLMGSIALLRQSYLDLIYYEKSGRREFNESLEAWLRYKSLAQVFTVRDYRSALRADRVGDEFGIKYIIRGSGDEYKRMQEIKATGCRFILPLDFPKAYDVSNPYDAINVNLDDMRHWEMAPANAGLLEKAGISFALTSDGLKGVKEFRANLLKAISAGLSREYALKALISIPAEMYGITTDAGSLEAGKLANFFICSRDYFDKESAVLEHWVLGKRYVVKDIPSRNIHGIYTISLDTLKGYSLQVSGDELKPEWTVLKDTLKQKTETSRNGDQFTLKLEAGKGRGSYRLNGMFDGEGFRGEALSPDGKWLSWSATKSGTPAVKADSLKKDSTFKAPDIWYPNMGYGWKGMDELPKAKTVLFRQVTVWTCEKEGKMENAEVLIRDGKIVAVSAAGQASLPTEGAEIIDGKGLHLTPGLIDEHSHIAINDGVNEGTQAITSEVRIGDVINPDDINIYRQLAGGVTTAHLLHGSANPIGGQTALIKLRWGLGAEAMKFEKTDGFIKFALGENVKQSNWGDNNVSRYPQTRMGVEQIYYDAFSRAVAYDKEKKNSMAPADKNKPARAFRTDLELEALAEILNKKRFITCHSYQQGEINMLMHVADSMGFKVNTFTHILEGYKVADKMQAHGAGASSFSDWWAYKFEVIEAIPYNGAILHQMGVTTAFNSDDAEMARRLNQEAAKAVKYGGVSEEEALKFVTLNPAKLLHIDQRTGSIKAGKDADLVLWNGPPLSVYSKPVKTFVDGVCYFDAKRDEELRRRNELERNRIVSRMLDEKQGGGATQKPGTTLRTEYHCNDMEKLPKAEEHD